MSKLSFLPFTKPSIDEDTILAVGEVLRSGWLTGGTKVRAFEEQLSDFFKGRLVRTFNSGTATLEIALRVAGIGKGDEVITSPISWVATSNAILSVGAIPVFVDIDARSHNIDLAKLEAAITPQTKAILPIFLCGLPVDMDKLYAIVHKYGLRVIEDAAQAFGATWKGKRIGSFGDLVCFSFQANKNITTGEGGCLVLNTLEEANLAEKYRLVGMTRQGVDAMDVDVLSGKFNLNDIAATIGLGQLKKIDEITAKRRALAEYYFNCFGEGFEAKTGIELPIADFENCNWHMFHLVLPDHIERVDFMQKMATLGIGIGCHYRAIHLFTLYKKLGFTNGMFPVAERIEKQIVTLPLFPAMQETDVERVVNAIGNCL